MAFDSYILSLIIVLPLIGAIILVFTNDNHLDRLNRLVPKSYGFKNDGLEHFGFIAQEVEKDFPNLVSMDDDGMKSVNYLEMIPLLLHKINYLERKLEEIKK
jgi:hypothetical protein